MLCTSSRDHKPEGVISDYSLFDFVKKNWDPYAKQ